MERVFNNAILNTGTYCFQQKQFREETMYEKINL